VDWTVEDLDLLNIRARGTSSRVLLPLETNQQTYWEVANYILALLVPVILYFYWRQKRLNELPMELLPDTRNGTKHIEVKSQQSDTNPENEL